MIIKKLLPAIKRNVLLKNYTTFKIGGPAKYFFVAKTKKDLIRAVIAAKKLKLPFFILGGGSNILISDKGYNGLIIKIQNSKFKIQNSKIVTEAGTPLGMLVNASVKSRLAGLEWAAGIPGTVGGAIVGNAGAFGKSMADIVKSVKAIEVSSNKIPNSKFQIPNKSQIPNSKFKIQTFKNKDCRFGYRESIFKYKKNLIILSCELLLKKGNKKEIEKKIKKNLVVRAQKQPKEPSAGSIFKNQKPKTKNQKLLKLFPELKKIIKNGVIPSAVLIEKCGLKGKIIGEAKISEKHANFIVNLGKAKAKDVKKLINLVKKKVKNKFGIKLEEEICFLGF